MRADYYLSKFVSSAASGMPLIIMLFRGRQGKKVDGGISPHVQYLDNGRIVSYYNQKKERAQRTDYIIEISLIPVCMHLVV